MIVNNAKTWSQPPVLYYGLSYLLNVTICYSYFSAIDLVDLRSLLFVAAVLLSYPLIYMLPVILLSSAIGKYAHYKFSARLNPVIVILMGSCLTILLFTDTKIQELFGFHINGFVLNLFLTRGGIESMGGSTETYITAAAIVGGICIIHLLSYLFAVRFNAIFQRLAAGKAWLLIVVFAVVSLGDRVIYGISEIQLHATVLESAKALPLYNRVTFRSLASRMGMAVNRQKGITVGRSEMSLNYPLSPIISKPPAKPLNVIWMVAESWRWDMLSREVMPKTTEFAGRSLQLLNHYSGGNGTRQGLFALFYGIYGSYWDAFLVEEKGPVFIDLLKQQNYQMSMYTGAAFTYPEFDKTIFAQIPSTQLHQFNDDRSPWKKDAENVSLLLDFIKNRQDEKPFFSFIFFESTHARYYFPDEAAIRSPYLQDLNYATMSRDSLRKDIDQLWNRYVNASHYLDSQFDRIFQFLDDNRLLDSTIVLVTGDHGEEFMEKGHWGHNAGFSEEQIRTPMILHIPTVKPAELTVLSSHMDVVPTLLPYLGVQNPAAEYSLGNDLINESHPTSYLVASDWSGVAYLGDQEKFVIPYKGTFSRNSLTTRDDLPIKDDAKFLDKHQAEVMKILDNTRKFLRSSGQH